MSSHRKSLKNRRVLLAALYGDECFYCGEPEADTVDHVIPTCLGGSNTLGNKVLACKRCNNVKGNLLPEVFATKHRHLLRAGFDWHRERRAEYDAYGIPCICRICGDNFYAVSLLKYCGKPCSERAREVHNSLFRSAPIYARLLFTSGLDVPPSIYKEFA